MSNNVAYPYLPEGRTIEYVPYDNRYIILARAFAQVQSLDKTMPGAAVIVKDGRVIGIGANGSDYHKTKPCRRVELRCKSGEGYELCEGCDPKNHSEAKAIASAWAQNESTGSADLYLWGHWWCCKPCWARMAAAGIRNVYMREGSEVLFNKEHPDNVVGRQFELA